MADRTVLITCVGGYYAYDIVRALRMDEELQLRVVGVDADSEATGRLFVDSFHTVPMAATDPDSFVESLLEICVRESVDIVIPGADEEVYALADAKQRFEVAGAKCAVADNKTLALTRDKVRFLETISDHGMTVPGFARVSSADDLEGIVERLGYPERRVILKPKTGRGARGLIVVDADAHEFSTGTEARGYGIGDVRRVEEYINTQKNGPALMAMEFLPGDIYDVDCVAAEGVPICVVPRRRLWDTPFSRGVEGHEIVRNEEMEQMTARVAEIFSLSYVFDCDFGTTADGRPGLLEVNPRWSGSVAAGLAGGVNVPTVLIRSMVGLPLPNTELKTGGKAVPVTRMVFQD